MLFGKIIFLNLYPYTTDTCNKLKAIEVLLWALLFIVFDDNCSIIYFFAKINHIIDTYIYFYFVLFSEFDDLKNV